MKITKSMILPLISVICLAYGTLSGHQISNEIQGQIAEAIVVVVGFGYSVYGIFKNHKTEEKVEEK